MEHVAPILLAIAVFSVVHSVFGIGLLVFGTPTLLILGLPFAVALSWLLPASLAISAIQVWSGREGNRLARESSRLPLCLVPLVVALASALLFDLRGQINLTIGLALIAAAAIRVQRPLQERVARLIARSAPAYLGLMGMLHGFTNMGGTMLSIYASAVSTNKHDIRGTVAVYYLSFGIVEIATLAVLRPELLGMHSVIAALLAAAIYGVVGRLIFNRAAARTYDRAVTGFLALYGVAILCKSSI